MFLIYYLNIRKVNLYGIILLLGDLWKTWQKSTSILRLACLY